jgi:hypothetical protein
MCEVMSGSLLDVATLTVGCLRSRWLDRRSMRKGQQRGCPSARVDGLEPFEMSSPRAGPAGHLSGSDRATRCPTGKVPPAVHQVGAVGRAAVNANGKGDTEAIARAVMLLPRRKGRQGAGMGVLRPNSAHRTSAFRNQIRWYWSSPETFFGKEAARHLYSRCACSTSPAPS